MKTQVRPPTKVSPLLSDFQASRRREWVVDSEGGLFSVKDFASALKRASAGDIIILPPGEYPAFELRKNVEIRSLQPNSVTLTGRMLVSTSQAILRGLAFRHEGDEPALLCEKGVLVVDDCTVAGRIEAGQPGGQARLFFRNCLLGQANDAILLTNGATVELTTSRIADCKIGLALRQGTSAAIYHSRIERCVKPDDADPGAAIFGEQAHIYCEGVRFFEDGVAAYFRDCVDARLLASYFRGSSVASLVSTGPGSVTELHSCLTTGQTAGNCPQFFVTGGKLGISHTNIASSPGSAVSADQVQIELFRSSFAAADGPALDLRSCQLTGASIKCVSTASAGLSALQCRGVLKDSSFSGTPSVSLTESPDLTLDTCDNGGPGEVSSPAAAHETTPVAIDDILAKLRKGIGQDAARYELERLLRLAHATRLREADGLPATERHFHCVFMGGHGTGRLEAAQHLAEGLHALGIVTRPDVQEVLSLHPADHPSAGPGVVFVRVRQATGSVNPGEAPPLLEQMVSQPGRVVILAGERDEIRRLLRSSAVLDRVFRRTLFFSTYGPVELATVFAQYCERDHIRIGDDAAQAVLLAFHLYSERNDKRFANTAGVKALYEATRQRYLERSSASHRSDLELEPVDLEIPPDKAVRNAVERCPAFITFCPSCKEENPWLPGLSKDFACLHCDTSYSANWGIWRDSTTYRRIYESMNQTATSAISVRRIHLPTR